MTKDPKETSVRYLSRIGAKTGDLVSLITGSDWKNDQTIIELTQMGKILAMAKFMTGLDKITRGYTKISRPVARQGAIYVRMKTHPEF